MPRYTMTVNGTDVTVDASPDLPLLWVLRDMLGILDRHLASNEYFGGPYSIADMTMYSDVHLHGVKDIGLGEYANVKRWHDAIEARPAVQRAWGPFPA